LFSEFSTISFLNKIPVSEELKKVKSFFFCLQADKPNKMVKNKIKYD